MWARRIYQQLYSWQALQENTGEAVTVDEYVAVDNSLEVHQSTCTVSSEVIPALPSTSATADDAEASSDEESDKVSQGPVQFKETLSALWTLEMVLEDICGDLTDDIQNAIDVLVNFVHNRHLVKFWQYDLLEKNHYFTILYRISNIQHMFYWLHIIGGGHGFILSLLENTIITRPLQSQFYALPLLQVSRIQSI